uniref:Protein ALP1-like n=1 Tax=Tanacetum cinerariifolium TaxID=118510 RepID=A0A699J877_TANCI|nr:protein ALP1-like [Tanacetum cinerariifolium]
MNPYFATNPNDIEEERQQTLSTSMTNLTFTFFNKRISITKRANNDINFLDNSPLFNDLLEDKAPVAPFVVNGVGFEKGYYLADGIYSQWATFVKSFTVANDAKHSYFKKRQESAQKGVELTFGVLQGRWGIIQQPARQYHANNIRRTMYSCIIMHNMILEY